MLPDGAAGSERETQGDAQAVGVIFSGGTAAVAVHGFGNQCQAEAAVFFAVQGVVVLKEARRGGIHQRHAVVARESEPQGNQR